MQNYMTDSTKCQVAVRRFVEAHRKSFLGSDLKVLKRNDPFSDDALNPSSGKKATTATPTAPKSSTGASSQGNGKNSKSFAAKVGGTTGSQNSISASASAQSTAQSSKTTNKKNSSSAAKPAKQAPAAYGSGQSLTVKKGAVHKGIHQEIDPAHAAVAAFDSTVFNCLSCGKVCLCSPRDVEMRASCDLCLLLLDFEAKGLRGIRAIDCLCPMRQCYT